MKRDNVHNRDVFKERRGSLAPCAFLLGLVSAVAQVILIREMMTTFSGHELVFALVLGVWLLGIAMGSFWTRCAGPGWAAGALVSAVLCLPLTIIGIRFLKPVLGIPVGSMAGTGIVTAGAAILLLPLTILLGVVFAALSREAGGKDVYGHEALGFVAGGILMTWVFFVPLTPGLDRWSQGAAWPGYRIAASAQTRYGSIVVAERGGEKSLFENGRHLFTAGDAASAEEVHAGLLVHPDPRRVFLAGGGSSEAGAEVLKHPVERVDHVQLDPGIIRMEQREFKVPADPRLHDLAGDARAFLQHSTENYDVIVMNEGDPVSLLAGRLFTREFFVQARARLAPGGLLAVTIGSSENYVNPQGKAYARSVRATLASVFAHVRGIPGGRMTFIASDTDYEATAEILMARLKERGIVTQFMRGYYLADRMSASRMAEAEDWLAVPGEVSTDVSPVTSLRALVFASTRAGTGFAKFVAVAERMQAVLWLFVPALLVWGFRARRESLPLAGAAVAGFTQMVFQVATIFLVQTAFGHAYAVVGLLTAGFMLGAFFGVHAARYFRPVQAAALQALLAVLFIAVLMVWPAGAFVFPVMAGMAGGIQFALYAAMAGKERAGRVYGADVIGAACGALAAGLLLVPLWGMAVTMLFVAALNLGAVCLTGFQPRSVSAER